MIHVIANGHLASYCADDLITSGSIGIPVTFDLSEDFDGLSCVAVFTGSGKKLDVLITNGSCVVPHECVANAGGTLGIGVYGRNALGTIAIPTVWAGDIIIHEGAQPSGIDPSEPTPDWTAQVQETAEEAERLAQSVVDAAERGDFDGADGTTFTPAVSEQGIISWTNDGDKPNPSPVDIKGPQGETGPAGADGEDGISPTVTVTDITGGHRITITDADGAHSFDVMDGSTPTVPVTDVQVNGTSVLSNGVANVPVTSAGTWGVTQPQTDRGIGTTNGKISISPATDTHIKEGNRTYVPVCTSKQHAAAFYGLAKAAGADMKDIASTTVGVYPEEQKSAISEMLSGSVAVSGTTPTIAAKPGIRYVCGEVATLGITLPPTGIVDVVFESGSTATVLTVTPPSGVTSVKWANGFDPTALEANTTYELNILDGRYGVVASWT